MIQFFDLKIVPYYEVKKYAEMSVKWLQAAKDFLLEK